MLELNVQLQKYLTLLVTRLNLGNIYGPLIAVDLLNNRCYVVNFSVDLFSIFIKNLFI